MFFWLPAGIGNRHSGRHSVRSEPNVDVSDDSFYRPFLASLTDRLIADRFDHRRRLYSGSGQALVHFVSRRDSADRSPEDQSGVHRIWCDGGSLLTLADSCQHSAGRGVD